MYDGTPVGERTPGNSTFLLPDRIFLFRGPLIEDFPDIAERAEQIRITLIHELGHMIGFDEDDLEERGLE
jgi:predicted Zn-dependent protease with MMP-like domain